MKDCIALHLRRLQPNPREARPAYLGAGFLPHSEKSPVTTSQTLLKRLLPIALGAFEAESAIGPSMASEHLKVIIALVCAHFRRNGHIPGFKWRLLASQGLGFVWHYSSNIEIIVWGCYGFVRDFKWLNVRAALGGQMKFLMLFALFSFTTSAHAAVKPCKLVNTIAWSENQSFFEDALGYPNWNAIPAKGSQLGEFGLKFILGFDEQTRTLSALSLADLSVSTLKVDLPLISIDGAAVRGSDVILFGNEDVPHGAEAYLVRYRFNEKTRNFEIKTRQPLVDRKLGRLFISNTAKIKIFVGSQSKTTVLYGQIGSDRYQPTSHIAILDDNGQVLSTGDVPVPNSNQFSNTKVVDMALEPNGQYLYYVVDSNIWADQGMYSVSIGSVLGGTPHIKKLKDVAESNFRIDAEDGKLYDGFTYHKSIYLLTGGNRVLQKPKVFSNDPFVLNIKADPKTVTDQNTGTVYALPTGFERPVRFFFNPVTRSILFHNYDVNSEYGKDVDLPQNLLYGICRY